MIWLLRIFFTIVLISMLAVTTWASLQVSLFAIPRSVGGHPWFIATLFDTYWAFFTFYLWLAYKEPAWLSRVLWFVAIVLLGNIAMAAYGLVVTWRVPADTKLETILVRETRPVPSLIPALLLAAAGVTAGLA